MNSTLDSMKLTPVNPELLFRGRSGDPRLGEWVRAVSAPPPAQKGRRHVVILGSPDDLGVTRNRGRAGAAGGPDSIRRHLYRMTPPADFAWEERLALFDLGNVVVTRDIRQTHAHTRDGARAIATEGATVLSLGGGNDFTAPGFTGYVEGCRERGLRGAFGIVNVDPHLDARPLEDGLPHSGTPYRELVESGVVRGRDVVEFGAKTNRNAREQWEYCRRQKFQILPFERLRAGARRPAQVLKTLLAKLSARCAGIGVSIDVDCCADGEGTSAAPVTGFSAWEVCELAAVAGAAAKVGYFELVEVAPALDPAERTSRIAAEAIHAFLRARAK